MQASVHGSNGWVAWSRGVGCVCVPIGGASPCRGATNNAEDCLSHTNTLFSNSSSRSLLYLLSSRRRRRRHHTTLCNSHDIAADV